MHNTHSTQHTPSRRSTTESPEPCPPPATTKNTDPQALPPSQLRPVAVRVVHKLQHHHPSASRGGPHRKRTHAGLCAALAHTPNRSWHSAAPSSPSSHDRGAAGIAARHRWHVACSGRSWSRCSRSSAAPTSRSARPHSPVPAPVPSLRSTSAPCAHGAPSRGAPTQRSTPDAGANARSQRALECRFACATNSRPTAPRPGAAASAGRGGSRGALTSALQRCAARRRARRASVGAVCAGRGARGGNARVGQAKGRRWRGRGGG